MADDSGQPDGEAVGAPLLAYLRAFAAAIGVARLLGAIALVLGCSALDSAGLLMLVPMLQLVGGGATSAAAPAVHWLADHGLQPGLGAVLLLFLALVWLRVAASKYRDITLMRLRTRYVDATRERLEAALAHAAWPFLLRLRHADVTHVLFDSLTKLNQGTHYLMQGLAGFGMGLASVSVALVVAPGLTLAVLVPILTLALLLGRKLGVVVALGGRAGLAQRQALSASRDFLSGLKLIKAHAAEASHLATFKLRAQALAQQQQAFLAHQAAARGWFEVGGSLVLAAAVYGASSWGGMSLPELVVVVLVFARLLPVVREGHMQVQQLSHMLPAYVEVTAWLRRCELAAEGGDGVDGRTPALGPVVPEAPPTPPAWAAGGSEIRFDGVSFRFDATAAWAVADLTLCLKAGTTTVLAGASGAGKTTLVDLALGLLAPTQGTVKVGGQVLAGDSVRQWRHCVAYVAQDPYLFPGSIRQNLCWLAGPLDDAALWAALVSADAEDFVRGLPQGLDHVLGERGEGLSGGQRQRLALARALLLQPRLLVLDEPTSHLDNESHRRVQATIDGLRGRFTILQVAHRLEAARNADLIVVMQGGRVVQQGNWEALTGTPGVFLQLQRLSADAPPATSLEPHGMGATD